MFIDEKSLRELEMIILNYDIDCIASGGLALELREVEWSEY